MFLVMSPHVQTSQINPNGDQDAKNSQDNNRGDLTNTHSAPPTILFLHGNAGNIGHRYRTLPCFFQLMYNSTKKTHNL